MFTSKRIWLAALVTASALPTAYTGAKSEAPPSGGFGLGRPATIAEVRAWNIDVFPNGDGLPPGHGTAKEGAGIYAVKCAGCHGRTGREGPMPQLR